MDELDALRLSLSDVAIEEISTSVNLGDDEIGGPSNSRLPTQLAVRQFISNRLGGFVDKTVSTAAVPGAIVQLNVNGQLNADLIPATRQFTNTNTSGYQSRLVQVDDIPAIDLKAGDIATENYEQIELTLSGILQQLMVILLHSLVFQAQLVMQKVIFLIVTQSLLLHKEQHGTKQMTAPAIHGK